MLNLYLALSALFLVIFILGKILEKIRIPWIFSALLLGLAFSAGGKLELFDSAEFNFLAQLGMYFMLFLIGFEIDVKSLMNFSKHAAKTTAFIILSETIVGASVLHYIFNVNWIIALTIGLSFATIGEVALLPILDELGLTKTKFGQFALNVGVLDDVFEVIAIISLSFILSGAMGFTVEKSIEGFLAIVALFLLMLGLTKLQKDNNRFITGVTFSAFFMLSLAIFFLFIGISEDEDFSPLGALLAGIALKNFMPKGIEELFEKEMKNIAYGFFGPIFFFSVGLETDVSTFIKYPLLIIGFTLIIKITKILSTVLATRKLFGWRKSFLLGLLFTIKLSTSIVVVKLFYDMGLISNELFSILIGMKIWFKFFVPFLISILEKRWKIGKRNF